jgi:hypothetical protein
MASKSLNKVEKDKVMATNTSVRTIQNGYIVRTTKEMKSGRWEEKEFYSKVNPIKISNVADNSKAKAEKGAKK